MKRYELAKREGMNWQSILIADAESEIKELIRDCVRAEKGIGEVNKKINELITETVNALESEVLKSKVRHSFPKFASRVYVQWVALAGTATVGNRLLATLKAQKQPIPKGYEEVIKEANSSAYNRATPNADYDDNYEREVVKRIDAIAGTHATDDENPHLTLRAGVERQLRWEWQEQQMQGVRDNGVKLIWIDSHANCSERCQEWQGKLYSLDKTSGMIDGNTYQPIENATDIWEYTKGGKAYRNGCLTGFNCRHRIIPYRNNNKPQTVPEAVMKHQREVEKRQRELERRVRFYEDRLQASPKRTILYAKNKGLIKKWTAEYEAFSRDNGVPFYPSRLDI